MASPIKHDDKTNMLALYVYEITQNHQSILSGARSDLTLVTVHYPT